MELIIGSNVSYSKETGLLGCVNETIKYNANAFMFYTGSNQSAERFPINEDLTYLGHKLMEENNIKKENVVVHAPFIINLANNSDIDKWHFYISFLSQELERCELLGFDKLVLHPGSAVGITKETALRNISRGLDLALQNHPNMTVLLEYMSGKGTECGTSIEELKIIIDQAQSKNQLGVCLDTCHMHDSGIDLKKFDKFLDDFDKLIGIKKIKCIHINDSLNTLGAHKDRHANLGYGNIEFQTLLNIIYHESLENVPKLLETPFLNKNIKSSYAPYKEEIINIRNKEFYDFKKEIEY